MGEKQIILDFESVILGAELFDSSIAAGFEENLPYTVNLEQWGDKLYGPIGFNLGEENPVPEIPPGGIAYTNNSNYVCIFFGQTLAWSVEYIGQIKGDNWKKPIENSSIKSVTISEKQKLNAFSLRHTIQNFSVNYNKIRGALVDTSCGTGNKIC